MPNRFQIIGEYMATMGRTVSFLEVGMGYAEAYKNNAAMVHEYTGVEHNFNSVVKSELSTEVLCGKADLHIQKSASFWRTCNQDRKWDIIFIDSGDDTERASDMIEAKRHIAPGGYIFVHDLGRQASSPNEPLRVSFNSILGADPKFVISSREDDDEFVAMGVAYRVP